MRHRILFVAHSADWTGPANSLLLLLEFLREQYEVAVLLPGQGRFSEELARKEISFFAFPSLGKWSIPRMAQLVRREGFELVYGNNAQGCSRNAFFAARFAGVPYVCHIRGMAWDRSWTRLGYLWLADGVIAVSRACAASVQRFVRPKRLHVIYNGVPTSAVAATSRANPNYLRAELGLPEESLLLVSVSHLCERKGQEHAIAAMGAIRRTLPSAHLCLVGSLTRDGRYTDRLRTLVRENGLQGHVHLLGFRSDIPQLLSASQLLLHTAVADPHPRSVIEAMATGLPVVAFAVDGVAETVVDGDTGRLVPPRDVAGLAAAVLELARSARIRERMGEAGRDRVEAHFSDRASGAQVERVISEVISNGKRRRLNGQE